MRVSSRAATNRLVVLVGRPDCFVDAELEQDELLLVVLPHARRRDEGRIVNRAARSATKNSPPAPSKSSIRGMQRVSRVAREVARSFR
jgi:hypothetical protein